MKEKSKNFIVELKMFPYDIIVSLGESDSDLLKELKKYSDRLNPDELDDMFKGNHVGRCYHFTTHQTVIRLKKYPTTIGDFGVLHHEMFHAMSVIFHTMGIPINKSTEEVCAYTLEYLTKEIYLQMDYGNK